MRAYAFDLLAFARWLVDQDLTVGGVTTDALLAAATAALDPDRRR